MAKTAHHYYNTRLKMRKMGYVIREVTWMNQPKPRKDAKGDDHFVI